jgi:hypothetical protein
MEITKQDGRALLTSVMAGLIVYFITTVPVQYFNFISIPTNLNVVLGIFVSLSIGITYSAIAHHVREQQEENMGLSPLWKDVPDNIIKKYPKKHFDVNWIVNVGTDGPYIPNITEPYAVAEGPYCPKCGYKLDRYKKLSFFGWKDKYYWRCEPCDELYRRPDKTLFIEDEVVEKIAMGDFRKKNEGKRA